MHFTGPGLPSEPDDSYFQGRRKKELTPLLQKSASGEALIQQPHAGKPAGVFPGPQLAQGAAEAARVYARLDKTVHEVSCLGRVLQPEEMSLQGENACLPL